ncbi:hypothetical protein HDU76_002780 [Blyttiomyces sp. JEL0837]|nr:hypothetical protein HDU76_002780 [Blyttiomyces sp. JEL0837]
MLFNTFTALTAVIASVSSVQAFTDGRLLPSYFCNKPNGPLPYSLGGVLKRTVFNMDIPLAFDNNPNNNIAPMPINSNVVDPATGNTIPNTAFMLASIHSTANSIAAQQNILKITATNPADVLTPGKPFALTADTGDANNALDGMLIFAELANQTRVGTFTDTAGNLAPFPGCGKDKLTKQFFGMVHTTLLSETNTYTGFSFVPPANLAMGTQVAVHGLGVQDGGFGFWCQIFTVGASTNTPCTVTAATGVVNFGAGAGTGATSVPPTASVSMGMTSTMGGAGAVASPTMTAAGNGNGAGNGAGAGMGGAAGNGLPLETITVVVQPNIAVAVVTVM